MLRKTLAAVLAICLLLTALPAVSAENHTDFTDISDHWAAEYIKAGVAAGFINGTSASKFSPKLTLSRAMFVTMLWRIGDMPVVQSGCNFSDVPKGAYYYAAVCWAQTYGIVRGVSETVFAPNRAITREQLCTVLQRYIVYDGQTLPAVNPSVAFADEAAVSTWAKDAVRQMQQYGLVGGVGSNRFSPKGSTTRAEAVTVLVRFLNAIDKLSFTYNLVDPCQNISNEKMTQMLAHLKAAYPKLIRLESAGTSYEGRDIPLVLLGNGNQYLYFQANAHAREHLSTNYLLEVLDAYAYSYYSEDGKLGIYDIYNLLNTFTLVILPRINPDGANIVQSGFSASKTPSALQSMIGASKGFAQWKASAQGIDINRNFPIGWGDPENPAPAYAYFCGDYAGQAPETQAAMNAMAMFDYCAYFDIHMNGNCLYYANYNTDAMFTEAKQLASKISSISGYYLEPPDEVSGSAADWGRQHYRKPTLTVELYPSGSFPADSSRFNSIVWSKLQYLPAIAMTFFQ